MTGLKRRISQVRYPLRRKSRRLIAELLETRLMLTTVVSVEPPANSHEAPPATNVFADFDQDINGATVTPQTFAVHSMQRGQLVAPAPSVGPGNRVAVDPSIDFFPGELVQVTVTSGIEDTTGHVADPYVWQFRANVDSALGSGFLTEEQNLGDQDSRDVALGDLDGDGDLDAFVANFVNSKKGVEGIYLNNGAGEFSDSGQLLHLGQGSSNRFNAVSLGDLDGDGDLDAFVTAHRSPSSVWLNQGGDQGGTVGQFGDSGQRLAGAGWISDVSLGDLDGDGDLDAVTAHWGEGQDGQPNLVWLNDGVGQFSSNQSLGSSESFVVKLGDLDSDGDLDAFAVNEGANRIWLNQGGTQQGELGEFSDSGQMLGTSVSTNVALGDLDGDLDLDAFVVGGEGRIWLNNGVGQFSDGEPQNLDGSGRDVALGDLDGDGDLDAYIATAGLAATAQPNRIWLNNGAGQFIDSGQSGGNSASKGVGLGDLDGDGDLDAFVANQAGAANRVWLNGDPPAPVPGITVTPTAGLQTGEDGSTDSFTVELDTEPTANVTIGISSNNTSEGTVDKNTLTFTPSGGTTPWNVPQTVTVTGVDDDPDVQDGDILYTILTAAVISSDLDYNGLDPDDVTVTNLDDDGPVSTTMHVGDLDGTGSPVSQGKWTATVTIAIHDASDSPVDNATVSGTWSNGASGSGSCVTTSSGQCIVEKKGIHKKKSSVTFTVTNVTHATNDYDSGANHDPDGDSDGTSIVVSKASGLHSAAHVNLGSFTVPSLSEEMLQPVVQEAIALWTSADVAPQSLAVLDHIDVRLASLDGTQLGAASGTTIWIDRDAAGYGWSNNAHRGVNLLTAVAHEVGHVLGFEHSHNETDVMASTLPVATSRLLPGSGSLATPLDPYSSSSALVLVDRRLQSTGASSSLKSAGANDDLTGDVEEVLTPTDAGHVAIVDRRLSRWDRLATIIDDRDEDYDLLGNFDAKLLDDDLMTLLATEQSGS